MKAASAKQRDAATLLARTDPNAAEAAADRVEDPWYRSQALAWVVRYAESIDRGRLAQKAMDAAADCEDPFQQVGAAAWTVRALLEAGDRDLALTMLEIALAGAPRITPPASRSEALFLLFQAAFDTAEEIRRSLLFALAEEFDADPHWRVGRNLRDALVMAKDVDAEFVRKLAGDHSKFVRALETDSQEPRPFFW